MDRKFNVSFVLGSLLCLGFSAVAPSNGFAITIKSDALSPNKISKKLRLCNSPIFNYIKNDLVHIDFKAITDDQLDVISEQINTCL